MNDFVSAIKGMGNLRKKLKDTPNLRLYQDMLEAAGHPAAVEAALAKLKHGDEFEHPQRMFEHAFKAMMGWDLAAFQATDRLIARLVAGIPPPASSAQKAEAVIDIVSMIAKYARQAQNQGPEATARIVKQLDRFETESADVIERLMALEKNYASSGPFLNQSEVDLDAFARTMELTELREHTPVIEAIVRFTRTTPNEDDVVGGQSTLLRRLQRWRDNGPDPAEDVVKSVQGALGNLDFLEMCRAAGIRVQTDARTVDPVTGAVHVLDSIAAPEADVALPFVVRVLRNGAVVSEQWTVRAGERLATESKAFRYSSWTFQSAIDKAQDEVYGGFVFVDPARSGFRGRSLLATTQDLADQPARMRVVLEALNEMPEEAFRNRAGIAILPKTGQEYADWAFWVVRRFLE